MQFWGGAKFPDLFVDWGWAWSFAWWVAVFEIVCGLAGCNRLQHDSSAIDASVAPRRCGGRIAPCELKSARCSRGGSHNPELDDLDPDLKWTWTDWHAGWRVKNRRGWFLHCCMNMHVFNIALFFHALQLLKFLMVFVPWRIEGPSRFIYPRFATQLIQCWYTLHLL